MSHSPLLDVLVRLRARVTRIHAVRGLALAVVGALVVLICGFWIDLLIELPAVPRLATTLASCFVAPLIIVVATYRYVRAVRQPLSLARAIDQVGGHEGKIVAGADLLLDETDRPRLSRGFADLAVADAARMAASVPEDAVVSNRPATRACLLLAGLVAVAIGASLLLPRVTAIEVARFFDPFGDHPPYSHIAFEVDPGDTSVIYGDGFDVRVVTSGGAVDTLELVLDDGTEEQVHRLFPEADGSWQVALAGITEPAKYWVRCSEGRSHRYAIGVTTVPQILSVIARMKPPEYAHRPETVGVPSTQGLEGLAGTQITLEVESNRPLSGGTIRLPGETEPSVAMKAQGETPEQVTGTFSLTKSGRVEIHVVDRDGQRSAEPYVLTVTVTPDERPFVRILEPMANSFATPSAVLPVAIEAEDDVGLTQLELYRSLNDSRPLPQGMTVPPPPEARATSGSQLSLASYKLSPGDEIKLFARVVDNDVAGIKGSESQVVTVRIISEEDLARMVRMKENVQSLLSKYQEAQRRMEGLAREMEELEKQLRNAADKNQTSPELQEELKRLTKRMEEESKALAESLENQLPYDIDQRLSEELKKLNEQLRQAMAEAEKMAQRSGQSKPGDLAEELAELRQRLAQEKKEFDENVNPPLEHLAQVYPLFENAARFVELYQRQRSLAERAAALKDSDRPDDPAKRARMRDLQGEQLRLEEDLTALLDKIDSDLERLPENPDLDELRTTAQEFVAAVRESKAGEEMATAAAGFESFSGTVGAKESLAAADTLESFLSKCSGMGEACKNCPPKFAPSLSECVNQSMEQMLADAGLKQGSNGQGIGAGGGYSAVRSTLENAGIYGGPTMAAAASRGGKSDRPGAMKQSKPGGTIASDGQAGDAVYSSSASNVSQSAIPNVYRRRVADYFRRVAEELGTSGQERVSP